MKPSRRSVHAVAAGFLLALVAGCAAPPPFTNLPRESVQRSAPAPSDEERAPAPAAAAGAAQGREAGGVRASAAEEIAVTGNRLQRQLQRRDFASSSPLGFAALAGEAAPGTAIAPGDEVWFIALPDSGSDTDSDALAGTAMVDEDRVGAGTLVATLPAPGPGTEPATIPLPLEHTDVHATIHGYVGTVDVRQEFHNPYDEKIEAVYMFPLPEKAAVREFVMTIGERQIRGILREKEEAEQLYLEARAQGYRASLLVQHRPNVFEQKVANIEPGKRIDVNIRYFHTLAYDDGWYSFVLPTVVGPRYNPAGLEDPVAAVPRDAIAERPSGTAVGYMRPGERSAHDIGIRIDLDAGVTIEALEASHPVETVYDGGSTARIVLAGDGTIPNRDFVLRFKVAGDTIKSNVLTYVDAETNEGYFTMMVYPPAELGAVERQPVEMVFVLDTSGSMSGRPLEQAKAAVLEALDRLGPDDTFQIIRFASVASQLGPVPLPATEQNLRTARRYVEQLDGAGGTEMIAGIRAALAFPHDERRLRFVTFLTDGYIGNEVQIVGEVHRLIGPSRIFSFGVGNSVNRYLLERLASEGRGAVAYLGLDASAEDVMAFFFERISHPALTDLAIDFGTMEAVDVYPSRLPDLFVGRPVVVTGKFAGEPGDVTVHGRVGARTLAFSIPAGERTAEQSFIASLWARLRIADLADRQAWTPDPYGELAREIRDTALRHGLMSRYTAFIAVDASEQTAGTQGTTVHQAVPVPDGVRYETTVGER